MSVISCSEKSDVPTVISSETEADIITSDFPSIEQPTTETEVLEPIDLNIPCVTKEWIGKWQDTESYTTLNIIENDTAINVKVTFEESGYFNVEPISFYEKDGALCYEFNEEPWREIYSFRLENSELIGSMTRDGNTRELKYTKASYIPDDGEFKYIENYCPGTDGKTRKQVLREYSEYSRESVKKYGFEYALGESVPPIVYEYNYSDYVDKYDGICDELAFSLLDFVCDNFYHTPSSFFGDDPSVEGIINVCRENDGKTNCRGLSIILSGLLRANGINAAHITCMPYESPFSDCHVVVDCLLPSGARVMLDPTYHLYFTDKSGEYVSIQGLRRILISSGKALMKNEEAGYNGDKKRFTMSDYRNYMTKNTFRFMRDIKFYDGSDSYRTKDVLLIPLNYSTDRLHLDGLYLEDEQIIYSEDDFWDIK